MNRVLKVVGWIVGCLLGLSVTGLVALYIYVAEPHITSREWRISSEPETINVVYVLYACGDHSPRLYEIVSANGSSLQWSDRPTILSLPTGVPSPEDTEMAVSGNVFRLTGYRYQSEERNILTGATRSFLSTRFDLVSWQVRTPYSVWVPTGTDGSVAQEERTDPVHYEMKGNHDNLAGFAPRHYVSC